MSARRLPFGKIARRTVAIAAVAAGVLFAFPALAGAFTSQTVTVQATSDPSTPSSVDTGILMTGPVTITANGSWSYCCGFTGPGGDPFSDPSDPQPSVNHGALIGQVGGTTTGSWTGLYSGPTALAGTGELYMAMNDELGAYYDNAGYMTVNVMQQPCAVLSFPRDGQNDFYDGNSFTWVHYPADQGYALRIGTTPGGTDLLNMTGIPAAQSSLSPPALPVLPSGRPLYASLYTKVGGVYANCVFSLSFGAQPAGSSFYSPYQGESDVSSPWTFGWSAYSGAQGYLLRVGTSEGASNLANMTFPASTTSFQVNNLPPNQTLWARIYTKVGGVYGNRYQDISFYTGGGGCNVSALKTITATNTRC